MKPQNLEEKVVWYYIIGTYVLYFIGAQHILASMVAWGLGFYAIYKIWNQTEETPESERIQIPLGVWVWIIAILVIEITIIGSHLDFHMGLGRIIKTTINLYGRTWVLFALFPLIGCLKIRPQLVYRAISILCVQSIFFILVAFVAEAAGIPGDLYTSPLARVGGADIFYKVFLYPWSTDRLYLFAPWAPALGLIGSLYFFLAWADPSKKWRFLGAVGAAAMAWVSASRLSNICLVVVPIASWFLSRVSQPLVLGGAGAASFVAGLFGPRLIIFLEDFRRDFDGQRAASSQVRADLANITLYRWRTEAPIWGRGIIDPRGPRVVEQMPIGSHHHWFGLLFLHGIVGFIAFACAMMWTFIEVFIRAQSSHTARVSLSLLLVYFAYSFGENLEALAYITWPALVVIGITLNEELPPLETDKTPKELTRVELS
ncbi:O-antigen ligase family protein [Geitlerinema calcuttense]|uniref:O-antigen ligase domain-containing protein n=1 Tax=Geitlerinema calcuttense NRMC-F 0142 TaxID=2922238 RepID=A0ABT7M0K6_9CYAN|nr:O-antigen ligase domain-containing protein [Geitlerinema calcuttense]MDL5057776.1 O-antigen ligase domain-containing protein [Geitlerinema calcuttense NRMC-F 0142]